MTNPAPTPPPPANQLQSGQMYIGLCAIANGEGTRRWMRAQFFLLLHTPAFGATVTAIVDMFEKGTVTYARMALILFAAFAGTILSYAWFKTAKRSEQWLRFWCENIREIELLKSAPAPTRVFSSDEFRWIEEEGFTFHKIASWLPLIFCIGWFILLTAALAIAAAFLMR